MYRESDGRERSPALFSILAVTFAFLALVAPQGAAAGERRVDLFRQRYRLVATEPYLPFEGCEFDKAIQIGGQIFRCQTYDYVYQYGKAEVLARTFVVKGQSISSVYLCAGEDHCMAGAFVR